MTDETAHLELLSAVRVHAAACLAVSGESVLADVVTHVDRLGEPQPIEARTRPVVEEWLEQAMADADASTRPVVDVVGRHHRSLHWSIPYEDVDGNPDIAQLRTRYAYALLAGSSDGSAESIPWVTSDLLLGFVLQGPGVMYPAHHHQATEAYVVLGGTARWQRGSEAWTRRPPGSVIVHEPNTVHATHTTEEPTLVWVAWTTDADCLPVLD